ncbi:PaREP1 family protein [Infirmifilum sp. SLHALR2]
MTTATRFTSESRRDKAMSILLEEAELFYKASLDELAKARSEADAQKRSVLVRDAAEKAWNASVKAVEALLTAYGYDPEDIKTYKMKRDKLEELESKNPQVRDMNLSDRFAAREQKLHIRCFYDGECTAEWLEEELKKVKKLIDDVYSMLATQAASA